MTTLAVADLCHSRTNVVDFVKRLHTIHGPPRESIEQRIRANVAAQLGAHPNLAYAQAQAVNGWKSFRRTPDEAVRLAVACALSAIDPNSPVSA